MLVTVTGNSFVPQPVWGWAGAALSMLAGHGDSPCPQAWLGQVAPTECVGVPGVSQDVQPKSHWMSPMLSAVLVEGSALLPPGSAPLHSTGTGRGEAESSQDSCLPGTQ